MKFQTKLRLLAAFVTGVAVLAPAHAEDVDVSAAVVVNNAIDITVNSNLDFGTIAAFANSNSSPASATLVIPADPAGTITVTNDSTDTARIISLVDGSAADVSVAGAAPNTELEVLITAADATLTDPAGIATFGFTMGSFTKYAYLEGNGQTFGTTTDATGAFGLNIGATLTTDVTLAVAAADAAVAYEDATYTGSFEVSINY